jgi:plastocyanin
MRAKRWTGATLAAGIALSAIVAIAARAGAGEEVREIHLVARGMAFYQAGDPVTPNPTIAVTAGERVRFVLRNEAAGFVHDLAVADLGVALTPLAAGQAGALDLVVPARPGRHAYACRPHAAMMTGTLVIE